ncbi:hypothetical protein [Rhodococcus sp. Q]|uniref:hypothetical protein n=1 Tax=Rhodococcus sp. Q TaxID=2502252 RepID=UPI0010F8029E|nr:hypothetical protein [Rhodococcus sp. Q]
MNPLESTLPNTRELDAAWLRRSLGVCSFLEQSRALCPTDGAVVTFAVKWAPFGGPSPEDLLVTFGVSRAKFVSMLRAALAPRDSDVHQAREMKRKLFTELAESWGAGSRPA